MSSTITKKAFAVAGLGLVAAGGSFGGTTLANALTHPAQTTTTTTGTKDSSSIGKSANHVGIYKPYKAAAAIASHSGFAKPSVTDYSQSYDGQYYANQGYANVSQDLAYGDVTDASIDGQQALQNVVDDPYTTTNETLVANTALQADAQVETSNAQVDIDDAALYTISQGYTVGTSGAALADAGDWAMTEVNNDYNASGYDAATTGSVFTEAIQTNDDSIVNQIDAGYVDSAAQASSSQSAVAQYDNFFTGIDPSLLYNLGPAG